MRRAPGAGPPQPGPHRGWIWGAGVAVVLLSAVALFLALFNWDMARGPIARFAGARINRVVRIDGHLRVHLLTWTPTAVIEGLRIGNPAWVGRPDMAAVDRATVSVRLAPLLIGRIDLPLVDLERPRFDFVRDAEGQANWRFHPGASTGATRLPPIQHFVISDGHVAYADLKRRLTISGEIQASERRAGAYDRGFRLSGVGTIRNNPFRLGVVGGPLINVRADRPYPFAADIHAGPTHVTARGSITHPFDFGAYSAALAMTGPDLAEVYELTGLTFPNSPPYHLTGRLSRKQGLYRMDGLSGLIGESDIEGWLTVQAKDRRPNLHADLRSRRLVFADVLTVLGAPPKTRKEDQTPAQKAAAQAAARSGRLLPDAPLYKERLRAMDANVHFRTDKLVEGKLPLRQASVDVTLDHGVLDLNPLVVHFDQGSIQAQVRVDGRGAVPRTDLDARLIGFSAAQLLHKTGPPAVEATIDARAKLHGLGDSLHKAAANADGEIALAVPHGRIRQAFAELLGINVGKGLYLLLSKDQRETDLRCAVADFSVTHGLLRTRTFVVDTGVVTAKGSGTADLGAETLNLRLEGQSKKPRLLRIMAPITVGGSWRSPKVGVDAGKAVGQIGVGVALAALSPLAAILPFITPGGAKNADCSGLLTQAREGGVRVPRH